nr:hypothetical protein [uncultured Shinella sp.]
MNYHSRAMHNGHYENADSETIFRLVRDLDGHQYDRFVRSTTAHHDPIFTPIFVSLGLGNITIAGISAAAIASAIATTALSIGLNYLLAPKPPKPDDGKQPLTQAIPYRQWVVGRRRVAGALMLWEAKGSKLYAVQAIAGHKISAVNRYWLHDDEVTLDGSNNVQPLADGRYKSNFVQVYKRLGLITETPYAPLVDALSADDVWTSNHRGDGQASLAMVAKSPMAKYFTERFPYGAPRLSVEVDGAYVWDYRIDEDPSNPASWVFSRNAALIMCWHQCFSEFGHRRDYTRAILPVIDLWKEEADVCDEDVPLSGGGTEKRYLCDGFATAENDPKVGTNAILATCDGWLCERGDGALLFVVGKFREKYCGTLKDRDVTGYQLQHDVLFKDECNRLIPKITYPATDYTTTDTDFFEDAEAQLTSGRILAQEADYGWCTQWRQGRRLGIRDWRRFQEKMKGSLDVRLSGINAVYNRWVRMETSLGLPSLHGAIIENRRSVLALTKGGFTMDFVKHPENIDDWTPATDEGAAPPIPPKPTIANIPTPVIHSITPKAKSGVVYLVVSTEDPDHDDLSLSVRYRIKDIGGGTAGEWVEQVFNEVQIVGGFIQVSTNPVPSDQLLEVEAAFITARAKYGNWSAISEIFSTANPVAPLVLSSFTQTAPSPHLGNAVFSLTTSNDPNARTVGIYRVATGTSFNPTGLTPIISQTVVASTTYPGLIDGDTTRVQKITDPSFDTPASWTAGTGWTVTGGSAVAVAGSATIIDQAMTLTAGEVDRYGFKVAGLTAGSALMRFTGGTTVSSAGKTSNGWAFGEMTAVSGNNRAGISKGSTFNGSIEEAHLYTKSASCAPAGVWDYYAVPFNGSSVPGPASGPLTVTII